MDLKLYEANLTEALNALTKAVNQIIEYDGSQDAERPFPHGPGFAIGRLDAAIEIVTTELPEYLLEQAVENTLKAITEARDRQA